MSDDLFRRLTILLEAALPLLDREADAERLREAGKPLRQTTAQHRAAAAHRTVAEAWDRLGGDHG